MTRLLWTVTAAGVAMLLAPEGISQNAVAPSPTVLAQSLADNIFWTRRADRYTLQVVTQWRIVPVPGAPAASTPGAKRRRQLPAIDVWLLRKDGTAIPAFQRWATPAPKAEVHVSVPRPEVLYAFPLADGADAVAVVVRTDDDYVVKKIAPFAK